MRSAPWVPLSLVTLVGLILIFLATKQLWPWQGNADTEPMAARELADLAIASTQYLQALTTATFGGTALVLGQRFLGQARLLNDRGRRLALAVGLVALSLSLLTGFVTIESVIEAANQRLVHEKLEDFALAAGPSIGLPVSGCEPGRGNPYLGHHSGHARSASGGHMRSSRLFMPAVVMTLLAAAAPVAAQGAAAAAGRIEGIVIDANGAPIANAQVSIVGTSFNVLTNTKGEYFINNVPSGRYTIRAAVMGYASKTSGPVPVMIGETTFHDVDLWTWSAYNPTIEVRAYAQNLPIVVAGGPRGRTNAVLVVSRGKHSVSVLDPHTGARLCATDTDSLGSGDAVCYVCDRARQALTPCPAAGH